VSVVAELEWNSVGLVARPDVLENEAQVLGALRSAGYRVSRVFGLADISFDEPVILVVHLDSLLQTAYNINAYIDFLRLYSRLKQESLLRLILLSPPADKRPEMFVGCGALVDAYLTMPFSVQTLTGMVDRLV